ncbi:MAG: CRISPR-associated protein Cas4 [Thermoplasmata archaeon]
MSASSLVLQPEHLTPHDLVTYSRCPHEMELMRVRRASTHSPAPCVACTPLDVVPERHSPLFAPPAGHLVVNDGPLDIFAGDRLIYVDDGEKNLPVLFPPEQVAPDPQLRRHGVNLIDDELGLSGRPDLVVRRGNGSVFPVEYKETHVFLGYHDAHFENHGRTFDLLQAIAECRLVHAALGARPEFGVVWYGDRAGNGQREGWVQVPYTSAEENWLRASLKQIRADRVRAPVTSERNCGSCEPNRDGLCRFAAARFAGIRRVL